MPIKTWLTSTCNFIVLLMWRQSLWSNLGCWTWLGVDSCEECDLLGNWMPRLVLQSGIGQAPSRTRYFSLVSGYNYSYSISESSQLGLCRLCSQLEALPVDGHQAQKNKGFFFTVLRILFFPILFSFMYVQRDSVSKWLSHWNQDRGSWGFESWFRKWPLELPFLRRRLVDLAFSPSGKGMWCGGEARFHVQ